MGFQSTEQVFSAAGWRAWRRTLAGRGLTIEPETDRGHPPPDEHSFEPAQMNEPDGVGSEYVWSNAMVLTL